MPRSSWELPRDRRPSSMTSITSSVAAPARRRRGRRPGQHKLFVALLMTPATIGLLVFFVYPFVATIYFSFTRFDLLSSPEWVGLRNYRYMFTEDPYVWQSIRNTLWLCAVLVPCRVLFAMGVAGIVTADQAADRALPDDVLPAGARSSGRGDGRVRLPVQPGGRAGQPGAGVPAPAGARLVRRCRPGPSRPWCCSGCGASVTS